MNIDFLIGFGRGDMISFHLFNADVMFNATEYVNVCVCVCVYMYGG